ncbi:non-heme iron oxygenase ferredoxin subunit [Methylococcus geothermalis]|uniref:Rieske 2Fe-2S domain-containing protein n=1 Tax=Methylococcus geothermalis TaxID=2681310 RepID=A0A858Q8J1_9GAMM|nr:non-heme iron oxygenase ferredoxin subunit [Methylococcus geothermalis]QJD30026.1 Rieske 2Fe-2S domain-containing protein [Methylococcus geothermalis]
MNDWIDIAPADGFPEGGHVVADLDGIPVAVFKLGGEFYAIEDACTHDGAEIASGRLDGGEITCPRHGARFCLKTGKVLAPPAYEDLTCFPVRVEGGMIQVRDARWD